jgi:hypothetical protein
MHRYSFQIEPEFAARSLPLWSDPRPCPWSEQDLVEIRMLKEMSRGFGRRDDFERASASLHGLARAA